MYFGKGMARNACPYSRTELTAIIDTGVIGIALRTCALLLERPEDVRRRECNRVDSARHDAEVDAGTVTGGALFVEFASSLVFQFLLLSLSQEWLE